MSEGGGGFHGVGEFGNWWTITDFFYGSNAMGAEYFGVEYFSMEYKNNGVSGEGGYNKSYGFSVRCVQGGSQ